MGLCGGYGMKKTWIKFKKQYRVQIVMIAMTWWALLICYIPIMGNIIAFQDYSIGKGFLHSPWAGLKHFKSFFANRYTLQLLRNTLAMSVMSLVFGMIFAIGLALLVNEIRSSRLKRTVQTISYLPHFLSMGICANLFIQILGRRGLVNGFLQGIHVLERPFAFLESECLFWIIMTIQIVWKEAGWNAIIYLAAIAGISEEVYEAAQMDGANRIQRIIHVTLPGIAPTIVILAIMDIAKIFNGGFEQQLLMFNPSVMDYAEVINTYVYKRGMGAAEFSYATAVGVFQSAVSILLLIVVNRIAKKFSEVSLW